ncbi:MAG: hypothetical protein GQE15_39595 [Archangiaceae bacterium]|nr:hypothetical protein [Archangiaceae bacterium]
MRALLLVAVLPLAASAQDDAGAEVEEVVVEAPEDEANQGYSPDESQAQDPIRFTGYLDVGFAKATGNGSSFRSNDDRVPLDYGNDAFAPAVNSRGEVASTDSTGRFTNGFLPRSVGIGSTPSLLLNTLSADVRVQPRNVPVFLFARLQLMPRLLPTGDVTRVELQQAFGRLSPFKAHEFAVFLGRFDSVFGIEYLENEANLRLGITPSLTARYTTGHGLGAKAFYRLQVASLWSAFSVNVAGTTNGTRIEALVPVSTSLTGAVVGSARLGYELNLQKVQVKLGVSGLYGPRNDVRVGTARQLAIAGDLRVNAFGFSLAGEVLRLIDERGAGALKVTGTTQAELASGFQVMGGWARLGYTLPFTSPAFTGATLYVRYDRRHGQFEGFTELQTDRLTGGVRVDLFEVLALKAEVLLNRELAGAPLVDNDVFTSSAVFTW